MLVRVWREKTAGHCYWECTLIAPLLRIVWKFLEKLKWIHHMIQPSYFWVYIQRKSSQHTRYGTAIFITAPFTIVKIQSQARFPLIDERIKKMLHIHTYTQME
jgi:hypothetical protein